MRDFFGPTQYRLKIFGGNFVAFFVEISWLKRLFRANFVLQTCHVDKFILKFYGNLEFQILFCSSLQANSVYVYIYNNSYQSRLFVIYTQFFISAQNLGDRFLSSAGAGGNCARPMRLPNPSPVLDKNRAPMGPGILSSTGARVWRKAPMAFPDSNSVLDNYFQSQLFVIYTKLPLGTKTLPN